ncbi:hypothetical protein PIB30_084812 [Stylosanthes scabra]|uniref:Uncharacterized protein n=1 Tax=Stylosanthes scabra TaxID=79078 RepID=A0ABU6QSR8_9FABA|nr:hypothetical protein [Stylosanthes scabra]
MAKKKSCQNVRNPRVLFPAERELYGWVDAELRREKRLAQDLASERDYVLEAARLSDRLPFWALEDRTHFLWVYVELFTRLGIRLPFSDFQKELHAPPPGNGFLSFRAYQDRRLFDAFEESIQEFKWHYFKVLLLPGTRPFWGDDEGKSYPWVYWNSEARECRVMTLDPLETLAFDFLQSLPVGLGKRFNFRCRWILDHNDAEVGTFLDSLLADMEKQSRFDRLRQKMAEVAGVGPCSVLPHARAPPTTSGASASSQAGEEGAKEDPSADLKKKGRKRKALGASAEEAAFGTDSSWAHKVSPINRAFPDEYNFREALDAGLTNGPTREILGPLVPEQLLGTAQHLACQLTACLQRDSALAAPLLNTEIKSLTQQLRFFEGERLSALARMSEVEERAKGEADGFGWGEAAAAHWRDEWKSLAEETGDMVQETFEILMDRVRHLHPAIGFSMISLDTRWDPKAKRIYNPKAEPKSSRSLWRGSSRVRKPGSLLGGDAQEVVPEASVKEGGECLVPNM